MVFPPPDERRHAFSARRLPSGDFLVSMPGVLSSGVTRQALHRSDRESWADHLLFYASDLALSHTATIDMQRAGTALSACTASEDCSEYYGTDRVAFIADHIVALSSGIVVLATYADGGVQYLNELLLH